MAFYTATLSTESDGSGSGDWGGFQPEGFVMGIRVELVSGLSTVDVTISEPAGLQRNILAVTGVTSSTNYHPAVTLQDNAGTDGSQSGYYFVNLDNLSITLANGTTSQTDKCLVTINLLEV